jgi:hypothetical protein
MHKVYTIRDAGTTGAAGASAKVQMLVNLTELKYCREDLACSARRLFIIAA